ncbi:hypothetical protein ACOMHN_063698 [Nucella lapillus]
MPSEGGPCHHGVEDWYFPCGPCHPGDGPFPVAPVIPGWRIVPSLWSLSSQGGGLVSSCGPFGPCGPCGPCHHRVEGGPFTVAPVIPGWRVVPSLWPLSSQGGGWSLHWGPCHPRVEGGPFTVVPVIPGWWVVPFPVAPVIPGWRTGIFPVAPQSVASHPDSVWTNTVCLS